MQRPLLIAILCGAIPLALGLAIFLVWVFARQEWLMVAGLCNIGCGLVMFFVGVFCLAYYWNRASLIPDYSRQRRHWSTLACAGLLLLNFPVAGGLIAAAVRIETRYTVVIENETQHTLTNVRIFGGGVDETIDPVPPQGRIKRHLWFQTDGELKFQATVDTTILREKVDGYVTGSQGGTARVTIHPDKTITVSRDLYD